jgi:hypothetical protein
METMLLLIAVLACPVGMLLMGVFMWRGMGSKPKPGAQRTVEELRAEHRELGGKIERLEQAGNGAGLKSVER